MAVIRMTATWYQDRKPEYQAGREYDVTDAICQRFVMRGIAEVVKATRTRTDAPRKRKRDS